MKRLFLFSLFFIHHIASADVLVLIHGYLGSTESWQYSGVNTALKQQGWSLNSLLYPTPYGLRTVPLQANKKDKSSYAIGLASTAPIAIQSQQLQQALQFIRQGHPGEALILVGHSAGGIVARLHLIQYPAHDISALITIASPHLGTHRAEQALDITDIPFPFSLIPEFLGGNNYDILESSRGLLVDLVRPYPGSLLHWLNIQPHPAIQYYSIIRGTPYALWGDQIVPGYSQDMNNIPALRGKSYTLTVPSGHQLEYRDGLALLHILGQLHAVATKQASVVAPAKKAVIPVAN